MFVLFGGSLQHNIFDNESKALTHQTKHSA